MTNDADDSVDGPVDDGGRRWLGHDDDDDCGRSLKIDPHTSVWVPGQWFIHSDRGTRGKQLHN